MTFGQFVVGLFSETVFPYDKHLQFISKTQGTQMGDLLVGLLKKSSFEYDGQKSSESSNCSVYVYRREGTNLMYDLDCEEPYAAANNIERVVELTVWHATTETRAILRDAVVQEDKMFFPPNCKIQIECMGYPF
jgi:hypothetical protein